MGRGRGGRGGELEAGNRAARPAAPKAAGRGTPERAADAAFHRAFRSSPGARENQVSLHEFRARLGGTPEGQVATIRRMRERGRYSLGRNEGQIRLPTAAEIAGSIHEGGVRFQYILRRPRR